MNYDNISKPELIKILNKQEKKIQKLDLDSKRLSHVVETIQDGFFSLTDKFEIVHFNKASEMILQKQREDVLGRLFFDVFEEFKGSLFENKLSEAFKSNNVVKFETHLKTYSFDDWFSVQIYPFQNMISVFFQNITEKKLSENILRKTLDCMKQAESIARFGYFQRDMKSGDVFWSDGLYALMGYKSEEIVSTHKNFINHIHKDDREKVRDLINEKKSANLSFKLVRKNGDELIIHGISKNIYDEAGNLVFTQATIQNVTEFILTSERKDNLQKQIFHASKLASIGELAAGVAHEINNPLAILKSNMDVLDSKSVDKNIDFDFLKSHLEKQNLAIKRISNIVNGLRTYARSDTDHCNSVDVHNIILDSVGLIEKLYEKEKIFFTKNLDAEKTIVSGNIGKLQQVLINLFSNAKDAMIGKSQGTIDIKTKNVADEIVISIKDSGIGIEKDKLDRIFDSFYTTKEPGKGTGLGLSITHDILKRLNGRIEVDTRINVGTTFNIYLKNIKKEKNVEVKNKSFSEDFLKGITLKVLFVDDEDDIRENFSYILKKIGIDIDEARNGLIALEKLKEQKYDVVFTDLKMPVMDGNELILKAKNLPIQKNTKFVVMTGGVITNYSHEMREQIKLLADYYIVKPFSRKNVYEILSQIIK